MSKDAWYKYKTCPGKRSLHISQAYINLGIEGIKKFVQDNHLKPVAPNAPEVDLGAKIKHRGASKPGNTPTLGEYKGVLGEMLLFSYLVGDSRSATILNRELCPENPFPLKPSFVHMFYQFKCGDVGEAVVKPGSTTPMKTCLNEELTCLGTWNAKSNLNKIKGAIGALEGLFPDMSGEYFESCLDCMNANPHQDPNQASQPTQEDHSGISDVETRSNWNSCRSHAGHPLLRPRGSVLNSEVARSAHETWMRALAKNPVKGNIYLLPAQMRQVRNHLVNSGKLYDLQTYTMTILGVKLFLRADELIKLKVEAFNQNKHLFIVHPNSVRTLSVTIQGKNDPVPSTLKLYRDDECPEFCPVRHLLVYLRASNIKSGYIFPKWKHLSEYIYKGIGSGHFDSHITYGNWLNRTRMVLGLILPDAFNGQKITLGTHTLRKTGYLFAVWGVTMMVHLADKEKPISDIMYANILMSARHRSIKNAATYMLDNSTLYGMVKEERFQHLQKVGPWQPIHITTPFMAASVTIHSAVFQQDLPEMAIFFFEKELQLPLSASSIIALQRSCNKEVESDPKRQLLGLFGSKLPEEERHLATRLLDAMLADQSRQFSNISNAMAARAAVTASEDGPNDGAPHRKKRKTVSKGTDTSVGQLRAQIDDECKKGGRRALVPLLERVDTLYMSQGRKLVESDRNYAKRLRKVLSQFKKCLDEHEEAFYSTTKPVKRSNPSCDCNL